jgi:LPXTG-site transpeptidase (sortase) family protein
MNSWEIIYEYCDTHPNCTNTHCRKTVVIHGVVGMPSINLFSGKTLTLTGPAAGFLPRTPARGPLLGSPSARVTRKLHSLKRTFSHFFAKPTEIFAHRVMLKNTPPPARPHRHTVKRTSPQLFTGLSHALSQTYAIPLSRLFGFILLAIGLGGIIGPFIPQIRMESSYAMERLETSIKRLAIHENPLPKSAPVIFQPLMDANGAIITPVNENFAIVIPKIGINAPVMANVDPAKPALYDSALLQGVAHASTSFLPDGNGTVYLFSHSTSYEWFVKDLNAVFYLVKNLDRGDTIVLIYNRKRYTYKITDKKVVASKNTSYLYPAAGKRNLILQTCWPPGSTAERLLIFADLIEEGKAI